MSDFAIGKLIDGAMGDLEAAAFQRFESCTGTPIERIFETGLHVFFGLARVQGIAGGLRKAPADMALDAMPDRRQGGGSDIWYWSQLKILDWKVDFVVGMAGVDGKPHFVVIECDGHEFHERTKEQAAKDRSRDRRLQDSGFRIHRYTGHELYKDPYGCVSTTLVALINQAQGRGA